MCLKEDKDKIENLVEFQSPAVHTYMPPVIDKGAKLSSAFITFVHLHPRRSQQRPAWKIYKKKHLINSLSIKIEECE